MSHKAVRDFIRDTVLSINDNASFYYARESDFNQIKNKPKGIKVLLLPLGFDPVKVEDSYATNRNYDVSILFYEYDSLQGDEKNTESILDLTDKFLTKFQAKINLKTLQEEDEPTLGVVTTDQIAISAESVTERIKFTADIVSGWQYDFVMSVPDQFDYCTIYD